MHARLYFIDFLEGDTAGMEREAAAVMGRREYEGFMLDTQSDTAAYSGEFVKARELTRRAIDSARRADEQETMAHFEAQAAPREAMVGNMGMARQLAQAALVLSDSRDVEFNSALALGLAGDKAQATRRANDLDKRFSKDTMVQTQCLPMIRAATFLGRDNTPEEADKAIQALAAAAPYEPGVYSRLYPTYLRGGAYVAAREGAAAAAEFQKILNHPGIVRNDPIGALAHLGLGRACSPTTSPKRAPPTKTSSPSGKTPTPTSPS